MESVEQISIRISRRSTLLCGHVCKRLKALNTRVWWIWIAGATAALCYHIMVWSFWEMRRKKLQRRNKTKPRTKVVKEKEKKTKKARIRRPRSQLRAPKVKRRRSLSRRSFQPRRGCRSCSRSLTSSGFFRSQLLPWKRWRSRKRYSGFQLRTSSFHVTAGLSLRKRTREYTRSTVSLVRSRRQWILTVSNWSFRRRSRSTGTSRTK